MGQCGQGHTSSPITRPLKVVGIDGVIVRQISAGTSHSIAWTTVPSETQQITRHKPFCLDLHEKTFNYFKVRVFVWNVYSFKNYFTLGVLRKIHGILFLRGQKPSATLQDEKRTSQLRFTHSKVALYAFSLVYQWESQHLRFEQARQRSQNRTVQVSKFLKFFNFFMKLLMCRLVDIEAPEEIHNLAREVLNIGAPLLLPLLNERVEFLHLHLSSGNTLSQGQQMLLSIILSSLEDPIHIAALLGMNYLRNCLGCN